MSNTLSTQSQPNSLLGYKSQVISNEVVVHFGDNGMEITDRNSLVGKPDFDELVASGRVVPAHALETEAGRKAVALVHEQQFAQHVKVITDPRLMDGIVKRGAREFFVDFDLEREAFVAFIKRAAAKNPHYATLAKWATPESLTVLGASRGRELSTCVREVLAEVGDGLDHVVRSGLEAGEHTHSYNYCLRKAASNEMRGLGYREMGNDCFEMTFPQGREMPARLKLNEAAMHEVLGKFCGPKCAEQAHGALQDMVKAVGSWGTYKKALSEAEARSLVDETLRHIHPKGQTGRVMQVGLSNPNLRKVIVPGFDVSDYFTKFGAQVKRGGAGGFSQSHIDEIYAHGSGFFPDIKAAVVEEVLHNSLKTIYENPSQTPIVRSVGGVADVRQRLLSEAIHSDLNNMGRNVEIMRRDLHMSKVTYHIRDFYAEAVVKIMKMKEMGQWSPQMSERYKHLEHFIGNIILKDVEVWEEAMKAGKTWRASLLPAVDAALHRQMLPPVLTRQPFIEPERMPRPTGVRMVEVAGERMLEVEIVELRRRSPEQAVLMEGTYSKMPDSAMKAQIQVIETDTGKIFRIPERLTLGAEGKQLEFVKHWLPLGQRPWDIALAAKATDSVAELHAKVEDATKATKDMRAEAGTERKTWARQILEQKEQLSAKRKLAESGAEEAERLLKASKEAGVTVQGKVASRWIEQHAGGLLAEGGTAAHAEAEFLRDTLKVLNKILRLKI